MTMILLVAALLRFHDLGNVPRGLEHDEVATWHMVSSILEGDRPLYFEEGYGHEPLFNYITAIPLSIFGHNWLGERFWAPWLGMFAVAATYALMRRLFGPWIGVSAAAFQATVLWALFFNRLGLRLNQLPFLLCVTAYCFCRGVEESWKPSLVRSRRRWVWFVAAGAWMGLCFYTYMSSRIVPLIFGTFSLYLIVHERWIGDRKPSWRQLLDRWWPLLVTFVVAGLVMMPLVLYLLNRPGTTYTPQRESQVDRPLRQLREGNWRPVLENAWALVKMWNVEGELYWQLNYSRRPVFVEPISGVLFWVGACVVLWRWKEPHMALLAIWIGFGMVPSLLTSEAPSWPRTMLASPAALTLPGIAVSAIVERSRDLRGRLLPKFQVRRLVGAAAVALLVLSWLFTSALTFRDFLVVWPRHPRVRYAFQSSLTEALRYLDATADTAPVVMAGLSPHDVDPWTERSTLRRRDLHIRWVDARSALVLPGGDVARLVSLDITPIDPHLSSWAGLDPGGAIAEGEIVPRGGTEYDTGAPVYYDPAYTVYRLDSAALRERIRHAQTAAFVGSDPLDPTSLDAAPQFGGLVRLAGYEWLTQPRRGGEARLLTFWQALATGSGSTVYGEPALKVFVHLLDRDQYLTGVDTLGVAPDTWMAGDTLVQLHTFAFPDEPGKYAVEVGWYVPPEGPRLPVDGVDAPGRRILLEPVEVK